MNKGSVFNKDSIIRHQGLEYSTFTPEHITNSEKFYTSNGNGVARIIRDDAGRDELVYGIFVTEKHGSFEFGRANTVKSSLRSGNRRQLTTTVRGAPLIDPIPFVNSSIPGGCFPNDNLVHMAALSVIVDAGFVAQAIGTETDFSKQRSRVLEAVEDVLSLAQMIWTVQLNVRLHIQYLDIGSAVSPTPLSWSPETGCGEAQDAYNQLLQYVNNQTLDKWGGVALMLSQCFGNTDFGGIALTNSFCISSSKGVGVSLADPVTAAHELGHLFGSSHSLENGQGTTGGIMDVGGSGYYLNSQQFHPGRRPQVCAALTDIKTKRSCRFFTAVANSTCGDGILSPDEDCECPLGPDELPVTSCGDCRMCNVVTDAECSTVAVFRQPTDIGYIRLRPSLLALPSCCVNGKVPIATTCNGGVDMCSIGGFCTPICTTLGLTPCGPGASGCRQKCLVFGQCVETSSRLTARNMSLNAVPAGTNCLVLPGTADQGKCANGICIGITEPQGANDPASTLTRAPTPQAAATGMPSMSPLARSSPTTFSPLTAPSRPSPSCASFRKKGLCNRQSICLWSRNRCNPLPLKPAIKSP